MSIYLGAGGGAPKEPKERKKQLQKPCPCNMRASLLGFMSCLVSVLPLGPTVSKPQRNSHRESVLMINLLAHYLRLYISSYNVYKPIILVYVSHMTQYLFQWGRSHPASSVVWAGLWCRRVFFLCVAFIGQIKKLPRPFDRAELRWVG